MRHLKKFVFSDVILFYNGLDFTKMTEVFQQLPYGAKIVRWGDDFSRACSYFIVEHPSFDEVPETHEIPEGTLRFHTEKPFVKSEQFVVSKPGQFLYYFMADKIVVTELSFPSKHKTQLTLSPGKYQLSGTCPEDLYIEEISFEETALPYWTQAASVDAAASSLTVGKIQETWDKCNNATSYDGCNYERTLAEKLKLIKELYPVPESFGPKVEPLSCTHKWKKYEGLMYSYDFCEVCDEKKSNA